MGIFDHTHVHIVRTHTEAQCNTTQHADRVSLLFSFTSGLVCSYTIRKWQCSVGLVSFQTFPPAEFYNSHGVLPSACPTWACANLAWCYPKVTWAPWAKPQYSNWQTITKYHPTVSKVKASLTLVSNKGSLTSCIQTDPVTVGKIILLHVIYYGIFTNVLKWLEAKTNELPSVKPSNLFITL